MAATWAVYLLPYLEQSAAYGMWAAPRTIGTRTYTFHYAAVEPAGREVLVPVYFCPARRRPSNGSFTGTDLNGIPNPRGCQSDYAVNMGPSGVNAAGAATLRLGAANEESPWPTDVQFDNNRGKPFTAVADGLSNTFCIGEKHISEPMIGKAHDDRSVFDNNESNALARAAGALPGNTVGATLAKGAADVEGSNVSIRFGSWHQDICQFVFMDGSVRAMPVSTDLDTLGRLANRIDGLVVNIP